MRLLSVFLAVLAGVCLANAQDQNPNGHKTTAGGTKALEITSAAGLPCATGEAQSRYESCSSSLISRVNDCKDDDFSCACDLAQSQFGCITSHCGLAQTSAICAASYLMNGVCSAVGQQGLTFTEYACPDSVLSGLASLVPASVSIGDIIASRGNSTATTSKNDGQGSRTGSTFMNEVPSQTSAGNAVSAGRGTRALGDEDSVLLSGVLGVGICVAVTVAGVSALL